MRILQLNPRYPSEEKPFVASSIKAITGCLREAGAEVDLLVYDRNSSERREIRKDLIEYQKILSRFDRYKDYDLIYCSRLALYAPALAFKFRHMRNIVSHWHGSDIEGVNRRAQFRNSISYLYIPRRTRHIATSKHCATLVSRKLGVSLKNILISPSAGVDTDQFQPSTLERGHDVCHIGFASGLIRLKGVDLILPLLARKKDIEGMAVRKLQFHFIRYGMDKDHYSRLLREVDPSVLLHDPYPRAKMQEFYQHLDLLLFTTFKESLGMVALEAMSCGVPVVGTNDFAIPDFVRPGISGELFEKGSHQELETQMIRAIRNLSQYQPRKVVLDGYSRQSVIEGYRDLFAEFAK